MAKAKNRNRIVWCDRGWFPTYFGFCPSKKAWDRQMLRMGVDGCPYPDTDAKCNVFWNAKDEDGGGEKTVIIVTVGEHIDAKDSMGILGLLVHECAHVWQFIREDIGEVNPSHEAEAYAMQNIVMSIFSAYADTRGVKVTT